MSKRIILATDVGGTFTDVVQYEFDTKTGLTVTARTGKVNSTPPSFELGVMEAIKEIGVDIGSVDLLAHGSTIVINAITERKGVKTGLITTRGFRDVLEIARGDRPDFFNLKYAKPPAFVPRHLRLEVTERMNFAGEVLTPLDLTELPQVMAHFRSEGVEAVAICLLHAYANPAHEKQLLEAIRSGWPELSVVASHQISRQWREYERTNTTALSAYVQPIAQRYLRTLEERAKLGGFGGSLYIMQSNGGFDTISASAAIPITMVESGPAGGILGAAVLGRLVGEPNIIALDIGGTTAKCSLIDNGRVQVASKYMIERTLQSAGYPITVPVVDIVEIGNGGGSIAWLDPENRLRVGPQSAGADPGPVAYGRGGVHPTTTDANLLTGRINSDILIGGQGKADIDRVRKAFESLGARIGLTAMETARGVLRIANHNMITALKLVSINRGYDPRNFTLVAFGGGGAMHASALARELNIPRVIIPANASVFSAWGMLMSDLRRDYLLTKVIPVGAGCEDLINRDIAELDQAARDAFAAEGFAPERVELERFGQFRYEGQEHSVEISLPTAALDSASLQDVLRRFHEAYEREYTYRLANEVELVGYHLTATFPLDRPTPLRREDAGDDGQGALKGMREVDFDSEGILTTAIYDRSRLGANATLCGPAIIEGFGETIVILIHQTARVDAFGNIYIQL